MKTIRGFEINTNDVNAAGESRPFKVRAETGAVFSLEVEDINNNKHYNFDTQTFETGSNSSHRLSNQIVQGTTYSGVIQFPILDAGTSYNVKLTAEPHFNTTFEKGLTGQDVNGVELSYNPVLLQKQMTQVPRTTIEFEPISAITTHFDDATIAANLLVQQQPVITTPKSGSINWTITSRKDSTAGFGHRIYDSSIDTFFQEASRESILKDNNWYATTTVTINDTKSDDGGGSTHSNYTCDDVSRLSLGMTVIGVSTGSLSGNPTLINVAGVAGGTGGVGENGIKLSGGQVFANGTVLTIKGYGSEIIRKAVDVDIDFDNIKIVQVPKTVKVRGAVSNTESINVYGTYGISKGAYIEGFGVSNGTNNPVDEVSVHIDDDTAGSITMTQASTIADKTLLTIVDYSPTHTITGTVTVKKFPVAAANIKIYLDLDKILRIGVGS
tara:strand:- start:2617 stop:3939 length:1323 start_codon:yes stop_codon:yes gene_type:complete